MTGYCANAKAEMRAGRRFAYGEYDSRLSITTCHSDRSRTLSEVEGDGAVESLP
jgi:hypothetical protein